MGDIFGSNTYKNRLLPTAIVTKDLSTSTPYIIATTDENDFYAKDLVMAAAALPKYYEPQR